MLFKKNKKKKQAVRPASVYNHQYVGMVFPEFYESAGKVYERRYDYQHVEVVGAEYCGNVPLVYGENAWVIQEPMNPTDREAVAICVSRNNALVKFGYLPRENRLKSMVNDFYRKGGTVLVSVDNPQRYTVSMAFYYPKKG